MDKECMSDAGGKPIRNSHTESYINVTPILRIKRSIHEEPFSSLVVGPPKKKTLINSFRDVSSSWKFEPKTQELPKLFTWLGTEFVTKGKRDGSDGVDEDAVTLPHINCNNRPRFEPKLPKICENKAALIQLVESRAPGSLNDICPFSENKGFQPSKTYTASQVACALSQWQDLIDSRTSDNSIVTNRRTHSAQNNSKHSSESLIENKKRGGLPCSVNSQRPSATTQLISVDKNKCIKLYTFQKDSTGRKRSRSEIRQQLEDYDNEQIVLNSMHIKKASLKEDYEYDYYGIDIERTNAFVSGNYFESVGIENSQSKLSASTSQIVEDLFHDNPLRNPTYDSASSLLTLPATGIIQMSLSADEAQLTMESFMDDFGDIDDEESDSEGRSYDYPSSDDDSGHSYNLTDYDRDSSFSS